MHDFRIVCSQDLTKFQWEDKNTCDEDMWLKVLVQVYPCNIPDLLSTILIVGELLLNLYGSNNVVLSFGLNLCLQKISHRPTIFALYLQFRASFKIIGFKSRDQKEEHGIKKQQIFQNPMAWCILLNKKTGAPSPQDSLKLLRLPTAGASCYNSWRWG